MTEMPDDFTADGDGPVQRINGVLDVPRPGRVSGWAIDRAEPGAAVTVTVLREGRVIAEIRADDFRPDLERGGIGTGRYGFAADLDPPLEPGFEFTITAIARSEDGTSAEVRPVGRARPAGDPDRRLAERTFAELTQLRGTIRHLASSRDRDAETRAIEMLDRVEIVQARLEQTLAGMEPPAHQSRGRGMVVAVALALTMGAGSLGLGVWSMFAG